MEDIRFKPENRRKNNLEILAVASSWIANAMLFVGSFAGIFAAFLADKPAALLPFAGSAIASIVLSVLIYVTVRIDYQIECNRDRLGLPSWRTWTAILSINTLMALGLFGKALFQLAA